MKIARSAHWLTILAFLMALASVASQAEQEKKGDGPTEKVSKPAAGKLVLSYTCVPQELKGEAKKLAARKAVEENPENKLVRRGVGQALPLGAVDEKGIISTGRKWRPGHVLRVRFLDGDPVVQQKVAFYMKQWSNFANIGFTGAQDNEPAEIQVSFAQKRQSWSAVGTDALGRPQGQPTMNYGWLEPNTDENQYSAVVLHETGHALGLIHEHMHPQGNIQWNKPFVLQDCAAKQGWSPEKVQFNIFDVYTSLDADFTLPDKDSIMMYPIPPGWTTNGFVVGWNTQLSDDDKEFIRRQYP